jgi:P27 family predicted phage terminase small subunit
MGGKGSGGRNRKPAAVKKAEGNRGRRPLDPKAPQGNAGEPAMPKYLGPRAREVWRELVPKLLELKVLETSDAFALAALCIAQATVEQAQSSIDQYGIVIAQLNKRTGVALLKTNPAVNVLDKAIRRLNTSLMKFGLDPASRSGLHISSPADNPVDPLDAVRRAKTATDIVQ